ncbi:hypothetical protein CHARACLAT_021151 [Characodon lateralis]|uniref:Uncharacterized protein n=1 Tax=Characodon lateralis TaxID=208331 RepID=A0ABU7DW36_9TELE|nr:hypothetical protein [Characodon lateralis]
MDAVIWIRICKSARKRKTASYRWTFSLGRFENLRPARGPGLYRNATRAERRERWRRAGGEQEEEVSANSK